MGCIPTRNFGSSPRPLISKRIFVFLFQIQWSQTPSRPFFKIMQQVCSFCLKDLPPHPPGATCTSANDYCTDTCADLAKNSFAQVERAAQEYGNLLQYCGETSQKFPLMAHRLACGTLQEHIGLAKGDQFPQQWLRMLAKPKLLSNVPESWAQSHALILKSLTSAFSPGERTVRKQ